MEALGRAAVSVGVDVAKATLDFIDSTGKLNDTAAAAQISTTSLQGTRLRSLAVGCLFGADGVGLKTLNTLLVEGQSTAPTRPKCSIGSGISTRDATGHVRSADDVLGSIADRLARYPEGPKRAAMATKLLGEAGPSWSRSYRGPQPLRAGQRARYLGLVIDEGRSRRATTSGTALPKKKSRRSDVPLGRFSEGGPPVLAGLASASIAWWKANPGSSCPPGSRRSSRGQDFAHPPGSALKWVSDNIKPQSRLSSRPSSSCACRQRCPRWPLR